MTPAPAGVSGLRRELGLLDTTFVVMGGIIGVGIFVNPGAVVRIVEHPGIAMLAWIVGGVLAVIGGLGLASMMTIAVVERTREIGVMKAIGAVPGTVVRMIVAEGLVVAGLSWIVAVVASLPLIYGIGRLGASVFGMPLPFILSLQAALIWLGLVVAISLVASTIPALRASRLVVREALITT